jgi:hypothetical protein
MHYLSSLLPCMKDKDMDRRCAMLGLPVAYFGLTSDSAKTFRSRLTASLYLAFSFLPSTFFISGVKCNCSRSPRNSGPTRCALSPLRSKTYALKSYAMSRSHVALGTGLCHGDKLAMEIAPNVSDVLLGRGTKHQLHPGNILYNGRT